MIRIEEVLAMTALSFGLEPRVVAGRAQDKDVALARRQPLVVMVSLEGCGFCVEAREAYLGPLRNREGQPVVQIDMRSLTPIEDFDGRPGTHDAMVRRWQIKVAPTVLFFGAQGREVSDRLIGAYLPDFYGAYLDERLALARKAVRG